MFESLLVAIEGFTFLILVVKKLMSTTQTSTLSIRTQSLQKKLVKAVVLQVSYTDRTSYSKVSKKFKHCFTTNKEGQELLNDVPKWVASKQYFKAKNHRAVIILFH